MNKNQKCFTKLLVGRLLSQGKARDESLKVFQKNANISVNILKKIESGTIHEINSDIPAIGFVRAK